LLASAALDRLLHHAHVIEMEGDTFRNRPSGERPKPATPKSTSLIDHRRGSRAEHIGDGLRVGDVLDAVKDASLRSRRRRRASPS
jgi:hypothetical protein